jgi:hypothetical protein
VDRPITSPREEHHAMSNPEDEDPPREPPVPPRAVNSAEEIAEFIREAQETFRKDYIVPVANLPTFDATMGFETLDQAIGFIKGFMKIAENLDPEQREKAAYRDIALYRKGRLLAVVRHGPGSIPEVTTFAPDTGTN